VTKDDAASSTVAGDPGEPALSLAGRVVCPSKRTVRIGLRRHQPPHWGGGGP